MPYCSAIILVYWLPYVETHHDDVIKWKHFPRYWPFVRRIYRSPVNSPHKGQWRGALMFTLICARIKGWVNNCEAGDLRRNRAHYDVIVMRLPQIASTPIMECGPVIRQIMLPISNEVASVYADPHSSSVDNMSSLIFQSKKKIYIAYDCINVEIRQTYSVALYVRITYHRSLSMFRKHFYHLCILITCQNNVQWNTFQSI